MDNDEKSYPQRRSAFSGNSRWHGSKDYVRVPLPSATNDRFSSKPAALVLDQSIQLIQAWTTFPAHEGRRKVKEDQMLRSVLFFAVNVCGSMLLFFMLSMLGLLMTMAAILAAMR